MSTLRLHTFVRLVFCLTLILFTSACGGPKSTITAEERSTYEGFVNQDIATLDDEGLSAHIKLGMGLAAAAVRMSPDETQAMTLKFEEMIARIESDLANETDKKKQRTKGRELYELKRAIGRGGA